MDHSIPKATHHPIPVNGLRIRPATPRDVNLLVDLQKRFSNQLGFMSKSALEEKIESARCLVATVNGEAVGHLVHGSFAWSDAWIFQCAVRRDAQRLDIGTALTRHAEARAAAAGVTGLFLKCRDNIDALDFWPAIGFTEAGTLDKVNARRRAVIVFGRALPTTAILSRPPRRTSISTLLSQPTPRAA